MGKKRQNESGTSGAEVEHVVLSETTTAKLAEIAKVRPHLALQLKTKLRRHTIDWDESFIQYGDSDYVWLVGREIFRHYFYTGEGGSKWRVELEDPVSDYSLGEYDDLNEAEEVAAEWRRTKQAQDLLSGYCDHPYDVEWVINIVRVDSDSDEE